MASCWLLALLCAMSVALGQVSLAQNSPSDFLIAHNEARARVGVGPMRWDSNAAVYAQNYANRRRGDCRLVNSGGPFGENLFWGHGREFTAADAVNSWANERQFYDHNTNACATVGTTLRWSGATRSESDVRESSATTVRSSSSSATIVPLATSLATVLIRTSHSILTN